mmetsp:Transcript_30854/g.31399  ORF Transcript_30854/g.31399 Transcript_30854/m.31399 type:complete len:226 (+) Transcript_30854:151-828(+)|eukprot:CAMPEP_0182425608 /NCGR_PEP_ID=MMETSP1167-20130531/12080_1 /TAXON_ID=2988 /ORGANISM="Mallomonas Sp, Strain CCMP3275" /LENGTH=225 /DNA_ID=CAMNT_0024606481 /DNA_START=143 /DNA_END=820 /DNA_ORIENTATION=-
MDAQHAMLMEKVGEGILQQAEKEEKKLDEQLKQLENMDEDSFEALRQKRKQNLIKQMKQQEEWKQIGHGRVMEIADTKEFFAVAKRSPRIVAHFYRGITPRCEIVDAHFQRLAPRHLETLFVKIDAEKHPFLVERLNIIVLPTLTLIINGKTEHAIIGFDEFGGIDDFSTEDMAFVLAKHKVLNYESDRTEEVDTNTVRKGGVNNIRVSSSVRQGTTFFDDDEDF